MNPTLAIELIFFGGILTTVSLALLNAHPEIGQITLISGAIGGGACLGMGIQGLISEGSRKVASIILVLIAILCAIRSVLAWLKFVGGTIEPMEPLWFTVFLLFTANLATKFIRGKK